MIEDIIAKKWQVYRKKISNVLSGVIFEYEFDCRSTEQTNSQIASHCLELSGIYLAWAACLSSPHRVSLHVSFIFAHYFL